MEETGTKECKKCHQLLPIDSFRLNHRCFENTCKKCQNIRDMLRKREIVKNNLVNNQKMRITKRLKRGTIGMSSFTYEELLRKQILYAEPKLCAQTYRWVEPITVLIKRLIKTSNVNKMYNYKTLQIKRSKYKNVRISVPPDTNELLKQIRMTLKITEPKITYDEIIWRLIENDKTAKREQND